MIAKLKRVFQPSNISLIRELVSSDFKLRYQGSALGYAWSLLRPLFMFGVLYIIFTIIFPINNGVKYPAPYLLFGLVMWQYFVESTVAGMNAITGRADLVRKVSIPKYTIVLSTNISALITFLLNMIIVIVFMVFSRVNLHWGMLLTPFFIVELVALSLSLAFLLSVLFVKFRDFSHIWDVVQQVLFYATPIIFTFSKIPDRHHFRQLIALNPLSQIFQDARAALLGRDTLTTENIFHSSLALIIPLILIALLLTGSALYFRRSSKFFAEEL